MEKPNRAERRKNKFGGGRSTAHGGWPTVQANPVFHGDTPADASPEGSEAADPSVADRAPSEVEDDGTRPAPPG